MSSPERSVSRFMMVPRPTMERQLKAEEKELADDIKNLEKKVRILSFDVRLLLPAPSEQIPGETVQRCSGSTPRHCELLYEFRTSARNL